MGAAVEIPVVVNIDKAFDDATRRLEQAMQPFRQELESGLSGFKLNINPKGYEPEFRTLESILRNVKENIGDVNWGFEHLTNALSNAKTRLSELYAISEKKGGLTTNQRIIASQLTESIILMEKEVDLRTRAGNIASEEARRQISVTHAIEDGNAALQREAVTMAEISKKISDLRGKLQNIDPKSKEWKETAKAIEKATADLSKIGTKTKVGSIDRLREDMRKLEEQWNAMSKKTKFDENGNLTKSAQKIVDKFRELTAEAERSGQSLSKTAGVAKPAIDSTTNAMVRQSTVMRQLTSMASMYVSVFGLLRFAKQLRDVTGELEFQRVALGRLIQDEEYGAKLFEQIKNAAKQSPFRIQQLVTYTKQLAAYRIEQENLYDTTMRLADISAGLGVKMDRIILAYGQVRAASVLRGQELRQFTEAGIPLVELLAEKFQELGREGTTTADVFKLISERAVPFSMISDIFEDLTDKGGMFYKMQEKQAETLKGKWEKLKDAFDIGLQAAGETKTFQWQNDLALSVLNVLAKNIRIVPKLIESMGFAWATYNAALLLTQLRHKQVAASTIEVMTAEQLLSAGVSKTSIRLLGYATTTKLVTKANAVLATSNSFLAKSFARLTLAILSNPYAAAAAAVIGLVSVFAMWRKSTDSANKSMTDLNATIERLSEDKGKHDKIEKMIDSYDRLANKADRSEAETSKLSKTIKTLQREFPELTMSMDDDTESIARNTAEMKKNNEERLRASRETAQASLLLAKDELSDLERNRVPILKNFQSASSLYEKLSEQRNKEGWSKWDERSYQISKEHMEKWEGLLDDADQKIQRTESKITRLEGYLAEGSEVTSKAWKDQLKQMQIASNGAQLFTPEQLEGWNRLYDVSNDLEKEWKKLNEDLEAMKNSMDSVDPAFLKEWGEDISNLESKIQGMELIQAFFGFIWGKKTTTKSGYQQDPFISLMNERIKFMNDFKKGYDDMNKYLSSSDAMAKVSEKMLYRGLSMGIDSATQQRAAKELSQWYEEAMNEAFTKAKKHGASGNSYMDFLQQVIDDKTNQGKALKDFQKLIQSLFDAKTDIDISNLKREMDEALKRLKEEIKRSETAKNFMKDILDLTGDKQLSADLTLSVYGNAGSELEDRMKDLLAKSFVIDSSKLAEGMQLPDLTKAISEKDVKTLRQYLQYVVEDNRAAAEDIINTWEKEDAELIKNFATLISKYGDTSQKIATIRAKAENEIQKVKDALSLSLSSGSLSPEEKKALEDRAREIVKALEANRDLDIFKQSDDYIKFFSEINVMTAEQAASVRGELRNAYLKAFHDGAISADELRRNLRAVDEQFKKLTEHTTLLGSYLSGGFDGANKKLQEYADNVTVLASKLKSGKELDEGEQSFITKMLGMFNDGNTKGIKSYTQLISAFKDKGGMQAAGEALGQMGEGMSAMAANGPGALAIVDAIFQAVHSTITSIQQMIDELNRMRSEENKVGEWFKFVSDFDKYTYSGWEKLKSGDVIGATADAVSSYISIFNNIQEVKVKRLNEDIKEQSRLIEDLEYSYSRLNETLEKSFGSEYIYNFNKQLEMLEAQAEAYRKQAEAERGKGKSAEEDVAKGYEKSARDIEDQITDLKGKLAEFFAGTDLASAAEDFADAWIDAYKEFGSVTDAMSERFNDMIQSMINKSLAAKIMQEMLQPIFDQIDEMSKDGLLSTQEIADIAALAQNQIPLINDAMTNLMTSLASAGLDVRTSTAGLHGISKEIAGASEESILGLAAGINTQNFYMSYMPVISENVASILSAMTGGVNPSAPVATTENGDVMPSVQQMVYDHLPNIDQRLANLESLFRSVITGKTSSTNTNCVAVR